MSEFIEPTVQQLKQHIDVAYRNHARLTGFGPNTIVLQRAHLDMLLSGRGLDNYAMFDGQDFKVRGMLVIADIYTGLPRVMFERRPRVK